MPASTSAPRWRACAICSTVRATWFRIFGRRRSSVHASGCGRSPRTKCRSSDDRRRRQGLSTPRAITVTACCSRHSPRAPSPISFSTIMTIRFCRQRRLSGSGSIEMAILSDQEVQQQLKNLADWTVEGRAIRKQYTFNDFPAAVAFVNRLVPDAEAADHHPDIVINYRRVTLLYSTHDEGGITQKDFDGAVIADRKAATR